MADDYLREEFDKFATKLSQLNLYQSEANKIYTKHHQSILDSHSQLPEWAMELKHGKKHFFHFSSPSSGEDLYHDSPPQMLEDKLEFNTLQKLKTYQWLLVEAYEAFEDFVESAYAFCGLIGLSIWVRPDDWNHGSSTDIRHYMKPPKGKDRTPYAQLKAFRQGSKHFAEFETGRTTGTNYRVILVLIEKLRHYIVHDGGYYKDAGTLAGKVQKELPGMDMKSVMSFVNSYFVPHGHSQIIDLLEYPIEPDENKPLGAYHDPMLGFFKNLVEYGLLLFETIHQQIEADKK